METDGRAWESTRLGLYGLGLAVVGVLLQGAGVLYRLGAPENDDPVGTRIAFALIAFGLLFASRWARFQPWMKTATGVYFLAVGVTVVYYAADTNFEAPNLLGMVLFQFGMHVVFPRVRDVVAFAVLFGLGVLAGLVFVSTEPAVHPAFLLGFPTFLSLVAGIAAWEREHLIGTILRQRDTLEERVFERTRELEKEVVHRRVAELRALESSRAKSAFLTRMSHELRTPINAIVGYAELIREDASDPEVEGDVDHILTASGQLLHLVDDVLDVDRIARG